MSEDAKTLAAGEYAALGLLKRSRMHGYEMARTAREEGLTEVCPLEQSALYGYLNNLEAMGLVAWTESRQGRRPPRKLYRLTPRGSAIVDGWLASPVTRMRLVRTEFLAKLHILASIDAAATAPLIQRQLSVCERYAESISSTISEASGLPRLVAQSRHSAALATIAWLESYLRELQPPVGAPA